MTASSSNGSHSFAEKRALICAPRLPEFDREGGSRRTYHLIEFLQSAGWSVSFAAEHGTGSERYAQVLQQKGVATYALYASWMNGESSVIDIEPLIRDGRFDLIVFAFWNCAETYLPLVRAISPGSLVVIDSIDVHFLRQSRRVFTPAKNGDGALDDRYAHEMMRELNAYAAADAVLTVSEKEAGLINDFIGRSIAYAVPDAEDVAASTATFADRKGMLFVGNFRHPPNVQAVEYLCEAILPKVPSPLLEEHPLYIVGNEPTDSVRRHCRPWKNVKVVGWVPSVVPYLHHVRFSLIPLLYGAGTKRKLMQSLMAGTPAVSTSIGIEGFDIRHNEHVLVADTPEEFADNIVRLHNDAPLWAHIAQQGRAWASKAHSREVVYDRFTSALDRIIGNQLAQ